MLRRVWHWAGSHVYSPCTAWVRLLLEHVLAAALLAVLLLLLLDMLDLADLLVLYHDISPCRFGLNKNRLIAYSGSSLFPVPRRGVSFSIDSLGNVEATYSSVKRFVKINLWAQELLHFLANDTDDLSHFF